MKLNWEFKNFHSLDVATLYTVLKLRVDVFVVEQHCPYPELDGKDPQAMHLIGYAEDGQVAAYARLFEPGISFQEIAIGRIIVNPAFRGKQLGHVLMKKAITCAYETYGNGPIKLAAQAALESFYEANGFVRDSDNYLEDGIPHVDMIKRAP